MSSFEFFSRTLPDQGYYCVATLKPNGAFNHRFFGAKDKAYEFAMMLNEKGETVYYAQSGFVEPTNRKGDNAGWFRSFWLDLDCGKEKPFKDQGEGIQALQSFCKETKLPLPTVVNSGTGLYAKWLLTSDVDARTWRAAASVLKGLCSALKFEVDPVRTADRASVLRPVGATNRKQGKERTVVVLAHSEPLDFEVFSGLLTAAAGEHKVSLRSLAVPDTQLNSEFQIEMSGEKPSAHKIADKCAQVGYMRSTLGNMSEPQWYSCIGLLKSTIESTEIIHEWSQGHPSYDRDETDRKVEQHKMHATTCAHFHSISPSLCVGCPSHGKINSPWRLGLPEPKQVVLPSEIADGVEARLPLGFSRTDRGIIYDSGDDGGIVNVYPYDIFPTKLTQDETLGQEIMYLRARDPHVGWFDVQVRTALLHDSKSLLMVLADQGIHPYYGKAERALFMQLLSGYMQTLKDNRRKIVLSQQMGWLEEPDGTLAFVLGDRLISIRGVEIVGIARCADGVVKSITKQGDLDKWATTTKLLDQPGLEPWAFTLAALGFGSPLMKFTGYKGSMLSMVGRSGLGKTAMGWWALSVWGNPEKLQMIQRDTQNATVARMSLYNNLPLFIDEITNIDPKVLSDLAYQITQGRDKHTLKRDRTERAALPWATIGAASSNKSLVDILGGYKSDASAEINRVFEYEFPPGVTFDGATAYRMFMANYGLAGEIFAQYLVEHQGEHAQNLLKIQKVVEEQAECKPEERFWAVTAACAIYGAGIAKSLGLFDVDMVRLKDWIYKAIQSMRGVKDDTTIDSTSWIGNFLSKYASNMIVVKPLEHGLYMPLVTPRAALYIRKDNVSNIVWVSRDLLKKELLAGSASYSKLKQELVACRALTNDNVRMVLGKGTEYAGIQEVCWQINLGHPSMGQTAAQLAKVMPLFDTNTTEELKSGQM